MSARVVVTARWWGFGDRGEPVGKQVAFVVDDAVPETWAEQIRRIAGQVPRADVRWSVISVPAGIPADRVLEQVGA